MATNEMTKQPSGNYLIRYAVAPNCENVDIQFEVLQPAITYARELYFRQNVEFVEVIHIASGDVIFRLGAYPSSVEIRPKKSKVSLFVAITQIIYLISFLGLNLIKYTRRVRDRSFDAYGFPFPLRVPILGTDDMIEVYYWNLIRPSLNVAIFLLGAYVIYVCSNNMLKKKMGSSSSF